MQSRWKAAGLCGLLALVPALAQATTLYLSPSGSDSNTGATAATALKTLKGVLTRVKAAAPTDAVDIVVAEGTYVGQSVIWTYFNGQPITFAPPTGATTKPVFDGGGADLSWFTMDDSTDAAVPTNLHFIGLAVTNYWLGLDLGRNKAAGNSHNEVREMLFERIGGAYSSGPPMGYAALRLRNSSFNTIAGNSFQDVRNSDSADSDGDGVNEDLTSYIHAIYAAHNAHDNIISDNDFNQVSGDAVRTRNGSDNNLIQGNRFVAAGKYSAYSDWVADTGEECPSMNNQFKDNTVGDGYLGPFKAGYVTHTYGPGDRCGGTEALRIIESGTVME
ncbi:right-handed parallel beta-helix repeat-containing protein [Pseudoxanthomonas sp.]|uniref:right-handed parallel beta-helix repeat-containing protein n=1 Tax=Pseudoxanthomonas sp. TaxID=1871049 RepID=UPI00263657C5|nr:right-handed parallel beta-helix repeat-containing protein [Pseudoxanthomonas sp.]WDS34600.1 MAG: right-handed parallel beta-helix repeat-containing protein [Pseudoxanthomonas sp.]